MFGACALEHIGDAALSASFLLRRRGMHSYTFHNKVRNSLYFPNVFDFASFPLSYLPFHYPHLLIRKLFIDNDQEES